jgi:predicted TIM-barrel fold metal-dependent hydrolase
MMDGYRILDSDIHVMEPGDLYLRYMDPKWGDRIPRATGPRGWSGLHLFTTADGTPIRRSPPHLFTPPGPDHVVKPAFAEAVARDYDATAMLHAMDIEGVDLAVLYRTWPLMGDEDLDPEYVTAICAAWNDWAADYARTDDGRLKCAALIPLHDPELAAHEAWRAVAGRGHVGVCILPNPIRGRVLHDPYFDPLWAAAQELDVPIGIHPGSGTNQENAGNRFLLFPERAGLSPLVAHPLEDLLAVVSFCMGGILERFPRLRVAFLEGNCGWLPWILHRMDDHFEGDYYHSAWTDRTLKPSERFQRQGFIAMDPDEVLGADVIKWVGDDNLLFTTDWPHSDGKYPEATATVLARNDLSASTKRKILWDNNARLYNL